MDNRTTGRMLGKCPACESLDCIALNVPEKKNAKCVKCGSEWTDWMELIIESRRKDIYLMTPVILEAGRSSVALIVPARKHIDFSELIDRTTESAIRKIFSGTITCKDDIDIPDDQVYLKKKNITMGFKAPVIHSDIFHKGEAAYDLKPLIDAGKRYKEMFAWIESFWRLIFTDELVLGDVDLGRGMMLKLSSGRPMHLPLAKLILYYGLLKMTESEDLTGEILDELKDDMDARRIISKDGQKIPGSEISEMIYATL